MKKIIQRILLCNIFLILVAQTSLSMGNEDSPGVIELRQLLIDDVSTRDALQKALDNVVDLPGGATNPWSNKTIEQLYDFLNEWHYFLPEEETGLDKIMEFSFLYYKNPHGLKFINQEPGLSWSKSFVQHRGAYLDSKESAKGVELWVNEKSNSNDDFVEPENGYQSFNEYFIRNLKPGSRPISEIDDDSVVVSPADCIIARIANNLEADSEIPTKGKMALNLSRLLDNSSYSQKFVGGNAYSCFLMPHDYHHYHSPVAGMVVESNEQVGTRLFGMPNLVDMVNEGDPGHNKDFSVFEDFKHGYLIIKTQSLGYVAMIPIGLQTVGSVVLEEEFKKVAKPTQIKIEKGEKVGHFAYGGSTVLLLFEKGRFNALSVKQGQRIGSAN